MDRIDKLCAFLDECESFADIGCDHGYCTRYMLERGLCKRAYVSDVSEKCLEKARKLLKKYIDGGVLSAVCGNGLEKIDKNTEQVLIAGMGGEEIIAILGRGFIPDKFVLQPMKNVREVREFLIANGAKITRDTVFESGGKFYFVIKGERNGANLYYSEARLEYGYELDNPVLFEFLSQELGKKRKYLSRGLCKESYDKVSRDIKLIEGILSGEIK